MDKSAEQVLENHRLEQIERKQQMQRELRAKQMKELETQLYYKKQEVERLKALFERLRRESVVKRNTAHREQGELATDQRQIKETQERLQGLDRDIERTLKDVTDRVAKEKAVIAEHERVLAELEKQKRTLETGKDSKKKTLTESLSRLLFFKKREEQESKHATELLESNQTQLHGVEQSLKQFGQEVIVLENKIRALRNSKL